MFNFLDRIVIIIQGSLDNILGYFKRIWDVLLGLDDKEIKGIMTHMEKTNKGFFKKKNLIIIDKDCIKNIDIEKLERL